MKSLANIFRLNNYRVIHESEFLLWVENDNVCFIIEKTKSYRTFYKVVEKNRLGSKVSNYYKVSHLKQDLNKTWGLTISEKELSCEELDESLITSVCKARLQQLELLAEDYSKNDLVNRGVIMARQDEVVFLRDTILNHINKIKKGDDTDDSY